ncbi:hypothetical protein D5F01_LYC24405 [Larimichthys crocea]|uniref:Uncharacterized protein n=1 Tax=Larimichthys crocea TaxID=215358 RepID=A0A6G0HEZ3_LARCR|nr:hypothetical protein D5F01_LYC24405 [Larimichthys crocea]
MAHVPPSSLHTSLGTGLHRASLLGGQRGLIILTYTHARTHKHTQRNQEEGPDMAHVPPSSLHTSLGKLGSTEPLSSWRSEGLIILTLHTHARTSIHRGTRRRALTWLTSHPAACTHPWANLGSTEPLSSWRSEGPDHTHTTHARTTSIHRGTRRRALTWLTSHPAACTHPWASWAPQSLSPPGGQRGLIILTLHTHAHTSIHRGTRRRALTWLTSPPSSLHTSLGKLGSTEPLSSWRSEGPDHTHTTHARTHKHTQRNQEEGPDMAHVPPSSLHTSLGSWAPQSLSPPGGQRGLIILTLHARTHKHTQRNQEEGPDMAHVPPSSLHTSLGKLGSTEPLSSWRSEEPDHTHTTHARTHKHTQRNQEEGPDMAHVPPSSLHTSLGKPGLHRASLLLEVRGA